MASTLRTVKFYSPLAGLTFSSFFKQLFGQLEDLARRGTHRICESLQRPHRRIPVAALQITQISPVKTGLVAKLFLRDSGQCPELPNGLTHCHEPTFSVLPRSS